MIKESKVDNFSRIIFAVFAIPWIVFGIQHFVYADFVTGLVPTFMPVKPFWVYFTGTAMIAAGASFLTGRLSSLAAMLLGVMLAVFICLIHVPHLLAKAAPIDVWTRPVQDLALLSIAFIAANIATGEANKRLSALAAVSRYVLAICLIFFGVDEFLNLDFLTAKIPVYLPLREICNYVAGTVLIAGGIAIFANWRVRQVSVILGIFLLAVNIFHHGYMLAIDVFNPMNWTKAMLDLAITGGLFILARSNGSGGLGESGEDIY